VQARAPAVLVFRNVAGRQLQIRHRVLDFFRSHGNARKLLLSEICTLSKFMFVMLASNAVSERSGTYLFSTTGEARPRGGGALDKV